MVSAVTTRSARRRAIRAVRRRATIWGMPARTAVLLGLALCWLTYAVGNQAWTQLTAHDHEQAAVSFGPGAVRAMAARAPMTEGEVDCSSSFNQNGGIVVYILVLLSLFSGLALICDDYFVTSLEVIVDKLGLSEDVAGATFMVRTRDWKGHWGVMDVSWRRVGVSSIVARCGIM